MSHLKILVSLMLLFLVFSMRVIVSQHLFPFVKVLFWYFAEFFGTQYVSRQGFVPVMRLVIFEYYGIQFTTFYFKRRMFLSWNYVFSFVLLKSMFLYTIFQFLFFLFTLFRVTKVSVLIMFTIQIFLFGLIFQSVFWLRVTSQKHSGAIITSQTNHFLFSD